METIKELLGRYNHLIDGSGTKQLKAWKGKRSDLEARIKKLIPKQGHEVKRSKKSGIGAACYALLGEVLYFQGDEVGSPKTMTQQPGLHPVGIAYSSILRRVNKRFPESAVNRHHLRWYANRMRSLNMPIPAHRERSEWDDVAA